MIKDLTFDDWWNDTENDIYYFVASKDMLKHFLPGKDFPDAIGTSINIECKPEHRTPKYALTAVSPIRENEDGDLEDYDWYPVRLTDDEIMECFERIPLHLMDISADGGQSWTTQWLSDSDLRTMTEKYKGWLVRAHA